MNSGPEEGFQVPSLTIGAGQRPPPGLGPGGRARWDSLESGEVGLGVPLPVFSVEAARALGLRKVARKTKVVMGTARGLRGRQVRGDRAM